jgi:ZIP family zinc transporter
MNSTTTDDDTVGWDSPNIPAAIIVSIGAGLSTAIGGSLVFFPEMMKRVPQSTILGVSLALSAGVMLYVSFIEIFVKSQDEIATEFDEDEHPGMAGFITTICFFAGMLVCIGLEVLVHKMSPEGHGHGDIAHATTTQGDERCVEATKTESASRGVELAQVEVAGAKPASGAADAETAELTVTEDEKTRLSRMGIMTALAIGVHNFPEGLATFLATVDDISSGASLGVAIAIHNIPEGLCVAMPIYYATGDKWKAFAWSLLSGITEPIGGIAGFAALQPVFTPLVYGIVFSMVGGMMVFIVCHELLPAAHRNMGDTNKTTMWFLIGMVVMATSLVLFAF